MRGNLRPGVHAHHRPGSIPACAGEPSKQGHAGRSIWVYPRVCGGTRCLSVAVWESIGLSPRVRGNHGEDVEAGFRLGSIPACAGEPVIGGKPPGASGVYPRVCGGTAAGRGGYRAGDGLSPRVRGNQAASMRSGLPPGSIPACAGEPVGVETAPSPEEVYPRVCGGTTYAATSPARQEGLSPRVRGNHEPVGDIVDIGRSIPACAGEPGRRIPAPPRRRVYPRVCGGTYSKWEYVMRMKGLSPRVRGNHAGHQHQHSQ